MKKLTGGLIFSLLFLGAFWMGCGSDKSLSSSDEPMALSKPAQKPVPASKAASDAWLVPAPRAANIAVFGLTVTQNGAPVSGAIVAVSKSIAGMAANYQWTGTTDAQGKVTVEIVDSAPGNSGCTGYYMAKATTASGAVIGTWTSMVVKAGQGRNYVCAAGKPAALKQGRIIVDQITSSALTGNLLGDSPTRKMMIYLPPGYEDGGTYPSAYLLHGVNYDETGFEILNNKKPDYPENRMEGMFDDLIAAGKMKPMIIVMPDAKNAYGGSYYLNSSAGGNYEDYIADDIVGYIDSHYRTIANKNSRMILGHSMGGAGALLIGTDRTDVFSAMGSLSGGPISPSPGALAYYGTLIKAEVEKTADKVIRPTDGWMTKLFFAISSGYSPNPNNPPYYVDFPYDPVTFEPIPAVFDRWSQKYPIALIQSHVAQLKAMQGIYFDIGDKDDFGNNYDADQYKSALDAAGIPYHYEFFVGTHDNHVNQRVSIALSYLSSVIQ
jgi:S-formylglutathione hydrolase FrmB